MRSRASHADRPLDSSPLPCKKRSHFGKNEEAVQRKAGVSSRIMTINFDKHAQAGKEFLRKVALELGDEHDTSRASKLLCATLHTLRDQSSFEESMRFLSQLPLFIKAIYVDGWNPRIHRNHFLHLDDFVTAVQSVGGFGACENPLEMLHDVQSVIHVMAEYVSEGERDDFRKTLPEGLRILLESRTS